MRLFLIRHAATAQMTDILCGRKPGIHLSDNGQQQARNLGRALKQICNFEAVYASPLERAIETAESIAEVDQKQIRIEGGLNEVDFGEWTGRPFSELHDERWAEYNHFRSMGAVPGGETLIDVQARAWRAVSNWMHNHASAVAAVTHGDVIRGLLLLLLGIPVDFISRLEISPASVSSISLWPGHAPIVHEINRTFP